jgi:hypothetical protein
MTEAEWKICTEPQTMLEFLRRKGCLESAPAPCGRKLRFFAEAYSVRTPFRFRFVHRAFEVTKRYAEGRASCEDLIVPGQRAVVSRDAYNKFLAVWILGEEILYSLYRLTGMLDLPEKRSGADILRCVFGPLPFRPIALDPLWLTSSVTSLASSIDQDNAFDRLPILADALEDCGCSNHEVLSHLRGGGEHTRGCWVVDLLLGKS